MPTSKTKWVGWDPNYRRPAAPTLAPLPQKRCPWATARWTSPCKYTLPLSWIVASDYLAPLLERSLTISKNPWCSPFFTPICSSIWFESVCKLLIRWKQLSWLIQIPFARKGTDNRSRWMCKQCKTIEEQKCKLAEQHKFNNTFLSWCVVTNKKW